MTSVPSDVVRTALRSRLQTPFAVACCALFLLSALPSVPVFAAAPEFQPNATLYLKDGSRLVGRLVRQDGEEVVFETEGGRVTYPQSRVSRVEFTETAPAAAPQVVETAPEPPAGPAPEDIIFHEPQSLDSVGIPSRHRLDFGAQMAFDMFHPEGTESDEFNITYMRLLGSAGYRFAPFDQLQLSVDAPFLFHMFSYGGTSGVLLEDDSSAGMGQVSLGAKVPFGRHFGVKVFGELPTGDPDEIPSLGEGLNYGAQLLAERYDGGFGLHLGAGTLVKSEYDVTAGGTTVKRDPGDVTLLSMALTTQGRPRSRSSRFRGASGATQVGASLEVNAYLVGEEKSGGVTVADTDGTATNVLLGVTIGSQSGSAVTLAKFGVAVGVGEESHQSFDVARGAGDFSYFGTVSVRWGKFGS